MLSAIARKFRRKAPEVTVHVHVDPSLSSAQLETLAEAVERRLVARQRRNGLSRIV